MAGSGESGPSGDPGAEAGTEAGAEAGAASNTYGGVVEGDRGNRTEAAAPLLGIAADAGDSAEDFPAGQGKRLHPVTPWRRAWAPLAGLLAIALQDPQRLQMLADLGAGPVLGMLALVLTAAALYGFLSWRVTRYLVTDTELRIRTGLLFRRTAHLRLDRIQSIDVTRPLLARAAGVAKLKMDVVGAASSDELAFVGEHEATALRAELLARAAGINPETAPDAGEAPASELLRVDTKTLAWSLALLGSAWVSLLAVVTILPLIYVSTGSLVAIVLAGVPIVATAWRAGVGGFLTQYDWTVSESPDGYRLDHGLLQREHATVPPGRIQSVRVVEPLLWRPRGWARVELEVAGQGHQSGMLVPVATRAMCAALISRALPGVSIDEAVAAVRSAPPRARWAVPIWRRGYGHGVTDTVFVARHGRLRRVHTLVPHAKVQSVRRTQGPWMQCLGLSDIHVDHGANRVATARLMDLDYARAEVDAQADRSRLSRRSAGPERWLT